MARRLTLKSTSTNTTGAFRFVFRCNALGQVRGVEVHTKHDEKLEKSAINSRTAQFERRAVLLRAALDLHSFVIQQLTTRFPDLSHRLEKHQFR